MEFIRVNEKVIYGLSARTNNTAEMSQMNGKIPTLWQQFDNLVAVDYQHGERVFGVYSDYASDHTGEFEVVAGFDGCSLPECGELKRVVTPAGSYLVFKEVGEMPGIAITAWQKVWQYFNESDSQYERCYSTDFEYYPNGSQIEIHIAVK